MLEPPPRRRGSTPVHRWIRHPRRKGNIGFTLVELVVAAVLVAVVLAFLLPVFNSVMERGRSVACLGNLRQFGIGIAAFVQEHNGLVPPSKIFPLNGGGADVWYKDPSMWAYTYVGKDRQTMQKLLRCPSDRTPLDRYDYNTYTWSSYLLINWDEGPRPRTAPRLLRFPDIQGKIVLLDGTVRGDGDPAYTGSGAISGALADSNPDTAISKRHSGGANCLLGDGAVVWKPKPELVQNRPLWGGSARR